MHARGQLLLVGDLAQQRYERASFLCSQCGLSIPILGYIHGPVSEIPPAAFATRFVFVPAVILSGLWMWKGHVLKRAFRPFVH